MEKDSKGYLHGYSKAEQDRLYQQARFLESKIYDTIDFTKENALLEIGCGVGAQTEILLEKFSQLQITGVDASDVQISRAKEHLAKAVKDGRVNLQVGNAEKLPFSDNSFDAAYVCWLLEHVPNPVKILTEARRVMKPGAIIYCNEVLNATFYLHPYSPATLQYWFAFNDHQWSIGGDPFVGAKLGNYLLAAGYQNVSTRVKSFHYDNRAPKMRAQMIDYWTSLLLSGTPELLAAKKTSAETVENMRKELEKLKEDPDSVFFYSSIQARGQVF